MIIDPNQTFIDKAQRLSSWGHWFTFFNILFALLLSSRFVFTDAAPSTSLGYAYLVSNWVGHTAFLTFIGFVLTIFPISIVFPYPRHIRGVAALIATVGMTLLTIDAYSYSRLGYHISGASLEQVFTLLTNTWNDHPLRSFAWVFGIVSAIFALELVLSNYTWKHIEQLKKTDLGGKFAAVLLTAFVASHCIHIWADANLNYDVTKQNNMFPLSYPATAKTLLAKNGLLDRETHQQEQANSLSLQKELAYYSPIQQIHCQTNNIKQDLLVLTTDKIIDNNHITKLKNQDFIHFDKHYVPIDQEDAAFNLVYGLPALYKNSIIAHQQNPFWYTLAQQHNINISFETLPGTPLAGFHFIQSQQANQGPSITFKHINNDQLDQFLNANRQNNIILIGPTPKNNHLDAISKTPMLVKWQQNIRYKGQVSQHLDINTTIIESWMQCNQKASTSQIATTPIPPITFGKNFTIKRPKVLAANYTAGTLVSISKDKITMLDDQGNELQISATNGYKLNQALDIPILNDTIKRLKAFSVSNN